MMTLVVMLQSNTNDTYLHILYYQWYLQYNILSFFFEHVSFVFLKDGTLYKEMLRIFLWEIT